MTIPPGDLPARVDATGKAPEQSSPCSGVRLGKGDLATVEAPVGYFCIRLPDGNVFPLHGETVRILGEQVDKINGHYSRSLYFRPEPWNFPEGVWPDAWLAVESYFTPLQQLRPWLAGDGQHGQ